MAYQCITGHYILELVTGCYITHLTCYTTLNGPAVLCTLSVLATGMGPGVTWHIFYNTLGMLYSNDDVPGGVI